MEDQVLTIEQMIHLQVLGVDTSKAKMAWYAIYETEPNWYNELIIRDKIFDKNYPSIPTFTLQEILEIMPNEIKIDGDFYRFRLKKRFTRHEITYINWEEKELICYDGCNLLTCAYRMLCWLAENNYIGGNNEKK